MPMPSFRTREGVETSQRRDLAGNYWTAACEEPLQRVLRGEGPLPTLQLSLLLLQLPAFTMIVKGLHGMQIEHLPCHLGTFLPDIVD